MLLLLLAAFKTIRFAAGADNKLPCLRELVERPRGCFPDGVATAPRGQVWRTSTQRDEHARMLVASLSPRGARAHRRTSNHSHQRVADWLLQAKNANPLIGNDAAIGIVGSQRDGLFASRHASMSCCRGLCRRRTPLRSPATTRRPNLRHRHSQHLARQPFRRQDGLGRTTTNSRAHRRTSGAPRREPHGSLRECLRRQAQQCNRLRDLSA
jgi:hypothetical protein